MSRLKTIVMLGLVLAVTSTTWAASGPPFGGTFFTSYVSRDVSRQYTGYLQGRGPATDPLQMNGPWLPASPLTVVYDDPTNQLDYYAPLGGLNGETAWGVVKLSVAYQGVMTGPNTIQETSAQDRMWLSGQNGQEIVGLFHGRQDDRVVFNNINPFDPFHPITDPDQWQQAILASGDKYALWTQDVGLYDAAILAGPGGRTGAAAYAGIGDDPSSLLVLEGHSVAGDQMAEVLALYTPAAFGFGGNGNVNTYIYLDGGAWQTPGDESFIKIFPFLGAGGTEAHLRLRGTINPINDGTSWEGTSFGHITGAALPEPVTMLGLGLGAMSTLGYLRKRRKAQK